MSTSASGIIDSSSSSSSSAAAYIDSVEVWAAAKIIGRECSTINKDYLLCKKLDSNPVVCLDKSKEVTNCSNEIVAKVKTQFPVEFKSFVKCLDLNDYRYGDCRKEEKLFLACWNKAYTTQP